MRFSNVCNNPTTVLVIGLKSDFVRWAPKSPLIKKQILAKQYIKIPLTPTLKSNTRSSLWVSKKLFRLYDFFIKNTNLWVGGELDTPPLLNLAHQTRLKLSKRVKYDEGIRAAEAALLKKKEAELLKASNLPLSPEPENKSLDQLAAAPNTKILDSTAVMNSKSGQICPEDYSATNNKSGVPNVDTELPTPTTSDPDITQNNLDIKNSTSGAAENETKRPLLRRKKKIITPKPRKPLSRWELPKGVLPKAITATKKKNKKLHKVQLNYLNSKTYTRYLRGWDDKKNKSNYLISLYSISSTLK